MTHETPSAGRWRRAVTALVALLMVTSVAVGAGAGTVAAADDAPAQRSLQEDDDSTGNETLDPADEVFVRENGDVILLYGDESNASEELSQAEYGLDVGEGIFNALIVTTPEEAPNATGSVTARLEPSAFSAEGDLTAPRPTAVDDLSLTIDGARTPENSRFDASGRLAVNTQEAPSLRLIETADTSLQATVAPNSFDASGEFSAQTSTQLGEPQEQSFTLTEGTGTYTLEARQNQTIREFSREQWNTSDRARRTIEQRYASVAEGLGGSATVTLDSYSFANTSQRGVYRFDVSYTIEYEGVDEGLERVAASQLANSEEFNLTRAEASAIATNVTALTIERASVDYRMGQQSVAGSADIQLENYNDAFLSGLDALAAYSPPEGEVGFDSEQLENVRARIEAQRDAELTRRYSLSATHTLESQSQAVIELQAQSRTENWQAYVAELESRDITVGSQEYSLSAETDGENVVANGSLTVEREGLVSDAVDQFLNTTEAGAEEDEEVAQARSFVRAFREAGFEKARTDITVTEGNVTVEAGAKFDDMAAFRDVLQQSGRLDLSITRVVGQQNETGALNQYVYAQGAVSASASESEVRELSVVDEDTTVNMPGTYDRSFPEMDTERAYRYLELEPPTPTPTADGGDGGDGGGGETDTGGQPGFGAAAALVAFVAAALLAHRRR